MRHFEDVRVIALDAGHGQVVQRADEYRIRREDPRQARQQIGMHHVAVNDVGLEFTNYPGHTKQRPRVGNAGPHSQVLQGNIPAREFVGHAVRRKHRDDQRWPAALVKRIRQPHHLLFGAAAHSHCRAQKQKSARRRWRFHRGIGSKSRVQTHKSNILAAKIGPTEGSGVAGKLFQLPVPIGGHFLQFASTGSSSINAGEPARRCVNRS